jgi:hypothetical protein
MKQDRYPWIIAFFQNSTILTNKKRKPENQMSKTELVIDY